MDRWYSAQGLLDRVCIWGYKAHKKQEGAFTAPRLFTALLVSRCVLLWFSLWREEAQGCVTDSLPCGQGFLFGRASGISF